jgi:hypothetical protein
MRRRDALILTGASLLGSSSASAATPSPGADQLFTDRWAETVAYLKLRARANDGDAWYWFNGTIDLMPYGEKGVTIVNIDCLNLRRVKQTGDKQFSITMWEGAVFTDPATGKIAETIRNPVNGRMVEPMHYREGPTEFIADENGFRVLARENASPLGLSSFNFTWTLGGGHVWVERSQQLDIPNPLKVSEWPLESAGERLHGANSSTLHGMWADVMDPKQLMPPADMVFTASGDWYPWMLMGQRPGSVLYRAKGPRFQSLEEAPARLRQLVEAKHPELFRPIPWTEKYGGVITDHLRQRKPVKP